MTAFAVPLARFSSSFAPNGAPASLRRPSAATPSISVSKRPRACVASPAPTPSSSSEKAARVESGYWDWEGYGRVHYRHSGPHNGNTNSNSVPTVLFVPGFGCGAFHFEANVLDLSARGFRVYAMDKLGLGDSTVHCREVAASVTLGVWRDQITAFIEHVLPRGERDAVFVVGNSLGGYLVAAAAAERPRLFSGVVLLNPAPFWLAIPPRIVPVFGYVVENIWWNQLTKPAVLKNTLQLVYYRTVDSRLVEQILAPTRRHLAKTIFRAILTSPPLAADFDTSVAKAFGSGDGDIPLACINGLKDPWVGPIWGMRIKDRCPATTVYELDPVGHCPHDEAPRTVDFLIAHWARSVLAQQPPATFGSARAPVVLDDTEGIRVRTKTAPHSFWERFANKFGVFGTFVLATLESLRL